MFNFKILNFKSRIEKYTQGRSQVYIIPTSAGFKYIFINFTLFLISLGYANNMALLVTFAMVSYLILQMLETHKTIVETHITKIFSKSHFANDINLIRLQTKTCTDQYENLQVELITQAKTSLKDFQLRSEEDRVLSFSGRTLPRGKYEVIMTKLFTYGTGGLFYVWRYFPTKTTFYIYPQRRAHHQPYAITDESKLSLKSETEFAHHIPYTHGLNSKRIDWKLMARRDVVYWKKHISNEGENVEINYHKIEGDKEERLKKMSYLIHKNFKESNHYKILLPNRIIPSATGLIHYNKSMEAISEL